MRGLLGVPLERDEGVLDVLDRGDEGVFELGLARGADEQELAAELGVRQEVLRVDAEVVVEVDVPAAVQPLDVSAVQLRVVARGRQRGSVDLHRPVRE